MKQFRNLPHTNAAPSAPAPAAAPGRQALTSRRGLLQLAGGALLAAQLGACRSSVTAAPATVTPATPAGAPGPWAGGGTRSIGAGTRFPNPFGASLQGACHLTCMTTIGPCHTESPEREDISDGWDGIPLRLALRVVDARCQPLAGALVEVWHTNYTGGYSGEIMRMCNNSADDLDKRFFRGYQRSNADGVVHFNTCYPGWYSSRAVHIHLRVQLGDYLADDRAPSSVITQLLFSDALNADVFGQHPLYQGFGQPDTTLDTDNVVGGETDKQPYLFDVQRMDDGVMFAHKTLVVRRSADEPVCEARGAHGGGPAGPGGPGRSMGRGHRPPPGFQAP
ncbi:intradiol ring-cleavage dioxygenase [Corticibacter populi]|nr:intradiol ring-cleavage dioxygenase [Corticibacter populi]RZS35719.1 dioxygenase-like protein [Corticibacter populi]